MTRRDRYKAALAAAISAVVCLAGGPSPYPDHVCAQTIASPDPKARLITAGCKFGVSENSGQINALTDASLTTVWTSSGDAYIDISAAPGEEVGSVYIQWEAPPDVRNVSAYYPHSVRPAGSSGTESGPDGYTFVNDFIALPGPASGIRISWSKQTGSVSVAGVRVFSPGEVPLDIQQWKPMLEKADMLLISTHADDEHLYFGGAMPVYAGEYGKKVQVAYFVDHGILRTRELLGGLWEVGVTNYPLISDFPDQYVGSYDAAVDFYGLEEALEFQVMLLRRFKPEVVLGHDLDGEYGHGAHMLNARSLTMALDLAADPEKYPELETEYGVWDVKKCYLHLYEENEIIMDWTLPLAHFGGRSGWDMAKAGYDHHVSQHRFKFLVRIEGPNDCRRFGLFRSTVGPDIARNDFFENIPVAEVTEPAPTVTPSGGSVISGDDPDNSGASSAVSDPGPDGDDMIFYFVPAVAGLIIIMIILLFFSSQKNRRKKKKGMKHPGRTR